VMWFRGFLQDEFGIAAKDINWVQAGLETPGRRDKFPLNLPEGFPLVSANEETLTAMLADGRLDAVMSARPPSCFVNGHPNIRRLFPDYRAAEREYYKRSGLFPIMHAVGIRRDVLEKNRWLAASVYKAFLQAKRIADADLAETTALKIGLPWVTAEFEATRDVMGADFWSYGAAANYKTLSTMARYSYEQGLAVRLLTVEEMFAEGNLGETKV
jgi:4,5-dihydroxyphthalate decarboxylase